MRAEELFRDPNPLAREYSEFRVSERLLLTGHSHQAWPDRAREGLEEAWRDAAALVDEKWARAAEKAEEVRRGYAALLGDSQGDYALASNTHDLVVRFLSALPLRERPRLVTTDGEFHTLRRQLDRLAEERVEVVKVPAEPAVSVGERLAAQVDDRTAAVLASVVFFGTGHIGGGYRALADRCDRHGAWLLVDAYHALNVVPFRVDEHGLERAFVVGGGYKYCQLGEGCCFLRIPPGCRMRPVVTGWFAEFDTLAEESRGRVGYADGAARFAGSTYDPVSHYRAARVFRFFDEQALDASTLRRLSQLQIGLLAERFDALDADPAVVRRDTATPLEQVGGFLVIESPHAAELQRALRERGVLTDNRGASLRFGPALYLSPSQLEDAMTALGEVLRSGRQT